jgi:transcriptional regulator GlxA family with amidase domain
MMSGMADDMETAFMIISPFLRLSRTGFHLARRWQEAKALLRPQSARLWPETIHSCQLRRWVMEQRQAVEAHVVALPETAGSALYGMIDVLAATGTLWLELAGEAPGESLIRPRIVSATRLPFQCGNRIPVSPDLAIEDATQAQLIILPELWLSPVDAVEGRHAELKSWLRERYKAGATIYSACSGSVLLASTGLLDGREATSHWGYEDLFRKRFPAVRFNPEPSLCFADQSGRIVTAGGTSSWHDLAIHIISRHCGPGEALRIAKVYLLKLHAEGQLPYASLKRIQPHADAAVRRAEKWLEKHFPDEDVVLTAVAASGIPERTLKRRFKAATGSTLVVYAQNLRIEEAKRLLETSDMPADDVGFEVGYENVAFFRRLFKRLTGLTPAQYRRMFKPIMKGTVEQ